MGAAEDGDFAARFFDRHLDDVSLFRPGGGVHFGFDASRHEVAPVLDLVDDSPEMLARFPFVDFRAGFVLPYDESRDSASFDSHEMISFPAIPNR